MEDEDGPSLREQLEFDRGACDGQWQPTIESERATSENKVSPEKRIKGAVPFLHGERGLKLSLVYFEISYNFVDFNR